MATTKIRFRASSVPGRQGTLFLQVIHRRVTRRTVLSYRLLSHEWDAEGQTVVLAAATTAGRRQYLVAVQQALDRDVERLRLIVLALDHSRRPYCADDVVQQFMKKTPSDSFMAYAETLIARLHDEGRAALAAKYRAALGSLRRFLGGRPLAFARVDAALLLDYERWMQRQGLCLNTTSFYMRNLRAIYNRAAADGLVRQTRPFARIYTGVARTAKRAITADDVRRLMALPLPPQSAAAFARDIFLFSFYTCGMSFVDIAHLKRSDIRGRYLCYRRQKTGQAIRVRWQPCMQQLVKKYRRPGSPYLFPIITGPEHDATRQCQNALHLVNRQLRILGELLALPVRLTSYVARHSWASIAKSSNVPLAAISEAMGHTSERTTRIYLAILVNTAADSANRRVLSAIMPEGKTKTAGRKKGMPR